MTQPRILDHDAASKTTEYYHFDPDTQGFVIETRQDITDIIELNKAVVNDNTGWKGEFHHVAHIPLSILMQLAQQQIVTVAGQILDHKKFRAWLNDPSNSAFRVKRGRV